MPGYIYKIQFPNGKHYIGLTTTSLKQREVEHKKSAKQGDTKCLYNAIRKYNMVETLELIEIDKSDTIDKLCEMEIRYIKEYNSYYMNGQGYNMTFGGEGTKGYIVTEDVKQRLSEMTKRYFENPEARQKQSDLLKKYFEDNPDAGKEHSDRLKKYFEDNPDAGKEHSDRLKKYFEDPEARQKNSDSVKNYYENNPTTARQKLSDGKGKNKPFDVFTYDGTYIKTFAYQFEAKEYLQKEHNITSTIKIDQVLSGQRKSSAGFVFKYK